MELEKEESPKNLKRSLKNLKGVRLFWDKRFANYTWIGIFISVLNIFLLWLFIDILDIQTVIASTLIIGVTFVLRYVLLTLFKIF